MVRLALCGVAFLIAACSAAKTEHSIGYMFDARSVDSLQDDRGMSQADILAQLGSPSARSDFGESTWYYISNQQERVAFFAPKVVARRVIAVTFDQTGHVSDVKELDPSDAKNIQFAKDFTPTEGHDLGVMEQLFGNLGRFNTASKTGQVPGQH